MRKIIYSSGTTILYKINHFHILSRKNYTFTTSNYDALFIKFWTSFISIAFL